MTTEHTPGPWKVANIGQAIYVESDAPAFVCDLQAKECESASLLATCKANARLIAAAPDLLAALQSIWPFLDEDAHNAFITPAYKEAIEAASAAIAKAKGGAP